MDDLFPSVDLFASKRMREQRAALERERQDILTRAAHDRRPLTADEQQRVDSILRTCEALDVPIYLAERREICDPV